MNSTSNEFYLVYSRRGNCPKRLLKRTTDLQTAKDIYKTVRVYKGDYKYLYREYQDTKEQELLKRDTSKTPRNYSFKGLNKSRPFLHKSLPPTHLLPLTIFNKAKNLTEFSTSDGRMLSVSKIHRLLLAHITSIPLQEALEFLSTASLELKKQQDLSEEEIYNKIKEEEEDLL
jgi:hypothetical protein